MPHEAGEGHAKARLTQPQVTEIRRRYAAGGVTLRALAAEHGVSYTAVQKIVSGERWASVDGSDARPCPDRRWTDAERLVILETLALPVREVAARLGRSASAVLTARSRLRSHRPAA